MAKAKVPASTRAPSNPVARSGLVTKLARKKKKKRFWKSNARGASAKPGSAAGVAVRPPRAPEDFSRNWRALQELLKQKSQASEKPLVVCHMGSKKQPEIIQRNRREISDKARRDEMSTEKDQEATGGSIPAGSRVDRKAPVPPRKASGAEHNEKGTKKRTNGDISPKRGDIKHKKWKAKEVAASAPAPPTEEDIWFDDVDPVDIEAALGPEAAKIARKQLGRSESSVSLVKEQAFGGLTKALAMDCEMVGVGPKGQESIAARVSIVNQFGRCVYDKYVKPTEPVTDYRTAVSGILPENLKQGEEFEIVQKEVAEMLKGRILVGHALHNDLKVLFLDHPKKKIRDTQKYKPFKSQVQSGRPSLKLLSEKILGIRVQQAEHCSVQDAQAAMRLYVMVKKEWESTAGDRRPPAAAPDNHTDDA
ncbi:RNA exonuclease 4 isoform X1 [Eulemur rufifrons]|uniref:RNA exonuclease 4 isoform X1 n=1 Tax=Eulemur rufifrons TaxID=859984 RepID=UPI0037435F35